MNKFVQIVSLLAVMLPAGLAAQAPNGVYEVIAMRRDRAVNNAQAAYREDSPVFIERLVSFGPGTASFDGYVAPCSRVTATTTKMTARTVFRRFMTKRHSPNYAPYSIPADYRLALSPNDPLNFTRYGCSGPIGDENAADNWNSAATFPLPGGQLAMLWEESYILILAFRPRGTPIRASFNCAKAATLVERTICADAHLAGWDRSIETAYRYEVNMSGNAAEVVAEQKEWLAERAKCGADVDCLKSLMSARVFNLGR